MSNTHSEEHLGRVLSVEMPLVTVNGLHQVQPQEILEFENGTLGQVLAFDERIAQVMVFDTQPIALGSLVKRTGSPLAMKVCTDLLGATLDALGRVLTPSPLELPSECEERRIDTPPLSLRHRADIKEPLLTGVSIIDLLLPLAKGQRELVTGDRKTGKTPFLLQTALAQILEGSKVVYCLIGKRQEEIRALQQFVEQHEISDSVVMVASSAQDAASAISLTPFTAMTVAEYLRDEGHDTLIIFDDLTTHAKFYRQIALLARFFPGRDSYPGDIFYVHARLLERAGSFHRGGGLNEKNTKPVSISALPVAETLENELTDYIVSNLISITDGHLLFDSTLLQRGLHPPVDTGLSVTRVGKQTRSRLARKLNQKLGVFLNRYNKTVDLTHFGSELSDEAKTLLQRGDQLQAFFRQENFEIVPEPVQLVGAASITLGIWQEIPAAEMSQIRRALSLAYRQNTKAQELLDALITPEEFSDFSAALLAQQAEIKAVCLD